MVKMVFTVENYYTLYIVIVIYFILFCLYLEVSLVGHQLIIFIQVMNFHFYFLSRFYILIDFGKLFLNFCYFFN